MKNEQRTLPNFNTVAEGVGVINALLHTSGSDLQYALRMEWRYLDTNKQYFRMVPNCGKDMAEICGTEGHMCDQIETLIRHLCHREQSVYEANQRDNDI